MKLKIKKHKETHLRIETEPAVEMELKEAFKFKAHNYKYHPLYKTRQWNGDINLFNSKTKLIYAGLLDDIKKFCDARNYEVEIDFDINDTTITLEELNSFIQLLKLPDHIEVRDYQKEAVIQSINSRRMTLLSPTASGKSLIIYLILRYFHDKVGKTLLIVPSTALVSQMYDDFTSYAINDDSWNPEKNLSKVMGGYSKENLKKTVISTWQSVYEMKKDFFDFDMILCDEVHGAKAKSITSIMEKAETAEIRLGFTGSLDDIEVHELTIKGLFGPIFKVIETSELIKQKFLSKINIKACILSYSDETKKMMSKASYVEEIDFLVTHEKRNKFFVNLSSSLKGNTLVLFNLVGKHGKPLYEKIKEKNPDKSVYFISGEIDGDVRNEIRKEVDKKGTDCIIVASYKTFQQGINIVNLHNIIFSHPTKAKIRIIQSIGRGLRKGGEKYKCTLFDITDDLKHKSRVNFSMKHFIERLRLYKKEKFPYETHRIDLE